MNSRVKSLDTAKESDHEKEVPEYQTGLMALALLLIVGTLLSSAALFAKAAPDFGWHPLALLQWSLLGAALLQFLVQQFSAGKAREAVQKASPAGVLSYMLVSGFLFAAPNAIATSAVQHVGAGFVALCFAFPLVFTYALSVPLGLDGWSVRRGLGVAFGVGGGVLLALAGRELAPDSAVWSVIMLFVPVIIAAANIYRTLHWPKGVGPLVLSAGMLGAAFIFLGALNLGLGVELFPASVSLTSAGFLGAQTLVMALLYVLYFVLQKLAGPVYMSQIGSVAAIIGLALAWALFAEVPGTIKLLAALAIGVGVYLVSIRKKSV